jgi:2-polyprenyl-3-methyl-5-hydroxy-6-metoxy-1,4-benzoquinol methylase
MPNLNDRPDMPDPSYITKAKFSDIVNTVAHGFEGAAEKNRPRLQPFVHYFPTNLGPVLDVGCGTGSMIELLAAAGVEAEGIDQDRRQVAAAQSRGLRAARAHAHKYLARNPNKYGGIFLRHIIEHFNGVEGLRLLCLSRKALQPGGIIAVITPNFDVASVRQNIFWLDITHQRPYPLPLLLHIFSTLGLEVVDSGCREDEEERDLFIVGRA